MAKKVKAGVIGGGVGKYHIGGYQAHPNSEVVAVADLNPVVLDSVCTSFGIPKRFEKYQDMLADPQVQQRLRMAMTEMQRATEFDYVVINHDDDLEGTALAVLAILRAEKSRAVRPRLEL